MDIVWHFVRLSSPLYGLVIAGYVLASLPAWRREWSSRGSRLIFAVVLPVMLFQLMSHPAELPPVGGRVLVAYFGSCFLVFFIGRGLARWVFGMDGVAQSVFALGGIFSNIVLTGLPIARIALGDGAVPVVALLLVFNALTLWTLVSVSVEWSLHGAFSLRGIGKTAAHVLSNPIIVAIIGGTAFGRLGLSMPAPVDHALAAVGGLAGPAALLALGLELAGFAIRRAVAPTITLCLVKLIVQPLCVWLLARALGLTTLEVQAVVLVASMAVGINVYLMAVRFGTLQGEIASSIVLSNLFAAITTPLLLAALHAA
ncbi:MAG: AEC family transporter [Proteobacteria bacterium]|nr:AEC family transporter [Pseudomonadota bacterium]